MTIRPDLQDYLRAEGGRLARRRRARTRMAGVAVSTGLAVLAFTVLPLGGSSLISPVSAVAQLRADLNDSGVLMWVRQADTTPGPDGTPDAGGPVTQTLWLNLQTGDLHTRTVAQNADDPSAPQETTDVWRVGDKVLTRNGADGPIVELDVPPGGPSANPVQQVESLLREAEAGRAERTDDTIGQTPAVKLTVDQGDGATQSTWISRDETPSVLRVSSRVSCLDGHDCDTNGAEPSPTEVVTTFQTKEWRYLGAGNEALNLVKPPSS